MHSEKTRQQRNEQNWFVLCGLTGLLGVYFWTDSIGATIAFGGLAALIGEGISAITRRLDSLLPKTNAQ